MLRVGRRWRPIDGHDREAEAISLLAIWRPVAHSSAPQISVHFLQLVRRYGDFKKSRTHTTSEPPSSRDRAGESSPSRTGISLLSLASPFSFLCVFFFFFLRLMSSVRRLGAPRVSLFEAKMRTDFFCSRADLYNCTSLRLPFLKSQTQATIETAWESSGRVNTTRLLVLCCLFLCIVGGGLDVEAGANANGGGFPGSPFGAHLRHVVRRFVKLHHIAVVIFKSKNTINSSHPTSGAHDDHDRLLLFFALVQGVI